MKGKSKKVKGKRNGDKSMTLISLRPVSAALFPFTF
jgi:hypothetical protein